MNLKMAKLSSMNRTAYFDLFAKRVSDKIQSQSQSAVVKSFNDQKGMWNKQTAKPRLSLLPLVMCLLIFIKLLGHLNEKSVHFVGHRKQHNNKSRLSTAQIYHDQYCPL